VREVITVNLLVALCQEYLAIRNIYLDFMEDRKPFVQRRISWRHLAGPARRNRSALPADSYYCCWELLRLAWYMHIVANRSWPDIITYNNIVIVCTMLHIR